MQFLTNFCIQTSKYFWTVSTNSHVPLQNLLSEPSLNLHSPVLYLSKFRIIDSHQPNFSWRKIQTVHYWRWFNVTWLAHFISRHEKHTSDSACETCGAHSSSDKDLSLLGRYATSTAINSHQSTWCNILEHLKIKYSTHLFNPNYC